MSLEILDPNHDHTATLASSSDVVALVRVATVETLPRDSDAGTQTGPSDIVGRRVVFAVEARWKGTDTATYEVVIPWGPVNCTRPFALGERYLMFSQHGDIPTDWCQPMYPAEQAGQRIKRLDELAHKKKCGLRQRTDTTASNSGGLERFRERVALRGGDHPTEWQRPVRDRAGKEHLRVWLQPRWAVEGGTVAFEFGVSTPNDLKPNGMWPNLLGEIPAFDETCRCYPESPFEVYVRYASGELKPRFGKVRRFPIPGEKEQLAFELVHVQIGHGIGDCDSCDRLDGLVARISVERTPGQVMGRR
jgi:hypothetical protein